MNIHSFLFLCVCTFSLFLDILSYDTQLFPCVSLLCFNHEKPGCVGQGR